MINKEIIELIYREMDKELSPEEQKRLHLELEKDPEVMLLYQQCLGVHASFEDEKVNLKPIDLKKEILNRINMEKYAVQEKRPEIKVVRSFWQIPMVRFAFVFVAGVFFGFLMFTFITPEVSREGNATSEMKGTLYDSRSYDNMKVADNLQYESPLAKAVFAVRYSSRVVEARIDLSSLYPIKSTIEFDFNDFVVLNVQNVSVNDQSSASAAANFVQINNTGDNKFIVQLYNKNSLSHQIAFKIYQNDMPIYQNAVTVNKE